MKTFNHVIKSIILICVFGFASQGFAANKNASAKWYQIEVLVFEPVKHKYAGETWPSTLSKKIPATAIKLAPVSSKGSRFFRKLPAKALKLRTTASKLASSRNYRVITLQGWQQPVKGSRFAKPVRFSEKRISTFEPVSLQNSDVTLNPPLDSTDMLATSTENQARIDGTVTVSVSRYLHMALKLRYYNPDVYLAEQIALQRPGEKVINLFEMNESRRMRSKEVHVFDHPYFGVIATITPIKRKN